MPFPLRWLIAFALVALMLGGCGGGSSSDKGDNESLTFNACGVIGLKVIGGEPCEVGDNSSGTPIVQIRNIDRDGTPSLCTGTAISSNAVLTAAHCFIKGSKKLELQTVFGVSTENRILIHPDFDFSVPVTAKSKSGERRNGSKRARKN